jgi:hypothetical protein
MGSKTLSLRDNRLKTVTSNKSNRMEFIDETSKDKKEQYVQFTKIVKISSSPVQCTDKLLKNPIRDSDRNCFYVFCRLSLKLSIFYPICIKSFMPIFDNRIP